MVRKFTPRQQAAAICRAQPWIRPGLRAFALLAACALSACGSLPDLETESPPAAQQADTALHARIDTSQDLAVAGEPLNTKLLRNFYGREGFEPVWAARPAQADSLVHAVLDSGSQGLNPGLFHADLLQRRAELAPLDRELVLTDAFLSYADALARGAVPVERRKDDQVLTPGPVDVPAALVAAIGSPNTAAAIDSLAPDTPTYHALRDALRAARARAASGDKGAAARVRTLEVNLERQRWLPRPLPANRAWVNIADQRLVLYHDGRPDFSTKVVVGQDVRQNQSPEFRATIDASLFNPPWVIPADIVTREVLPKISQDPDYLAKHNMILLPGGEAEQLAGPEAGLGLIMFLMPNKFDVYLHDTPDRATIFNRTNRRISHGCIRVEHPQEFASLLMGQPVAEIHDGIAAGGTTRHELPTPVPVFIVYETAFLDTDGTLQFRPDFYKRDGEIWQLLQPRHPARDAERIAENDAGPSVRPVL